MKVGDLVRHIYTGRLYLIASVVSHSLVTLVGYPSTQYFNTTTDVELVQ